MAWNRVMVPFDGTASSFARTQVVMSAATSSFKSGTGKARRRVVEGVGHGAISIAVG